MKLLLKRQYEGRRYTTGMLFIENPKTGDMELIADTIEPPVKERQHEGAIVAIPAGKYPVVVTWSPRFQTWLPLVTHVAGREGIRIHAGNNPEHTQGCILVGSAVCPGHVYNSRATLEALMKRLRERREGELIYITVK